MYSPNCLLRSLVCGSLQISYLVLNFFLPWTRCQYRHELKSPSITLSGDRAKRSRDQFWCRQNTGWTYRWKKCLPWFNIWLSDFLSSGYVFDKGCADSYQPRNVCEYYNPSPTSISYRGHTDRLYKRDFAGEMLDIYSDLRLVDYGFSYHRDSAFPQDDISWFLMEKRT